jgi:hypothetical protein
VAPPVLVQAPQPKKKKKKKENIDKYHLISRENEIDVCLAQV